jgi:hypothetical protein
VCLGDLSFFVDHVGDAARVLVLFGITGTVGEADGVVGVAEEGEGEVVLLGEFLVLVLTVETDAEDLGVLRFVLGLEVPEPGTFPRSTGCVGLRIEPEHHFLSAQIAQANGVAVVVDRFKVRRRVTRLQHLSRSSGHGSDDAPNRHERHSTPMGYVGRR